MAHPRHTPPACRLQSPCLYVHRHPAGSFLLEVCFGKPSKLAHKELLILLPVLPWVLVKAAAMGVTQELAGGLALPLLGAAPLGSVPRLTPGRSCHTLNLLDWLSTKQELPLTSTPTDLCGAFSTPAVIQTSGYTHTTV